MKLKNYLSILLMSFLLKVSCTEEYTPVLEDPDQRVTDTLTKYERVFENNEQYWKLNLPTQSGQFYHFLLKFDGKHRVQMLSDINETFASEFKGSNYSLMALMRPSIVFDTYNYLHLVSDPEPGVNDGDRGKGSMSDFSFSLLGVFVDSIALYGNFNKNYASLTKVDAARGERIVQGGWAETIRNFKNFYSNTNFPYLQFGNDQLLVGLDTNKRLISFTPFEGGKPEKSLQLGYAYELDEIHFVKPLSYKGKEFNQFFWDETTQSFYLTDGEERFYLANQLSYPLDVNSVVGYGKPYTYIQIADHNLPYGIESGFNAIWEETTAKFKLKGRAIHFASFRFLNSSEFQVIINYSTADSFGDPTDQNRFSSDCVFPIQYNGNQFTLGEGMMSGNWEIHQESFQGIKDYFTNSTFKLKWVYSTNPTYNKSLMAAFQKVDNANSFVYGVLK